MCNYIGNCDSSRSVDSGIPGFEGVFPRSLCICARVCVAGCGGRGVAVVYSILERATCAAEGYFWVRLLLLLTVILEILVFH